MFSKKTSYKLNWMKNKKYIYKVKKDFNFSLTLNKLVTSSNTKQVVINKIIKAKRLSGLFKRKFNMRTTVLKRRSFLFFFLEEKLKKKKYFKKRRFRDYKNYKISSINLYSKVKSIFFENRKILKWFFKRKNLKRQNKMSKYSINFLNRDSKTLLNLFEYTLPVFLVKCHFFSNLNDSIFFIKSGRVLINNKVEFNHTTVVHVNDLVRLGGRFNYYFFYRKSLIKSLKMSKKIN
jgi:hypothetical protein